MCVVFDIIDELLAKIKIQTLKLLLAHIKRLHDADY